MKEKFGVTGIIFDNSGEKPVFLLLHRKLNWSGWEFVKGGVEQGEDTRDAVVREIREETGLRNIKGLGKVAGPIEWKAKGTKYIYNVFLFRGDKSEQVVLAKDIVEHDGFEWVDEKRVLLMLTHNDNKIVFRKALEWIAVFKKENIF